MPAQDLLIKNGYVVTMDPDLGDLPRADVHLSGGAIRRIGPGLPAVEDALVIDAGGKVVLPGLVDTHRHTCEEAPSGRIRARGRGCLLADLRHATPEVTPNHRE